MALGVEEGVGHAAADGQLVELGDQVFQKVELGRDLGAADDTQHRALRVAERHLQRLQFALHGKARIGRQAMRDGLGGGVGPMRGRKRIVNV